MYSGPAAAGSKSDDIITESGGNVTIISRVSPISGKTQLRPSATLRPSQGTDGAAAVPQIRTGSKPGTDTKGVDGSGLSRPTVDFPSLLDVTIKRVISHLPFIRGR